MANENLTHQPELEQEKQKLAALYNRLDALEKEYQQKQQELQNKRGTFITERISRHEF